MSVDQTWTDPSTGGAIDLATDDVLTETIYDKVLSNLKRLGGTTGPTNVQAARGAFPVSGYVMGATGHDRHVESATSTTNSVGDTTITTHAYTFGNAFASAPVVAIGGYMSASTDALQCNSIAVGGLVIKSGTLNTTGVSLLYKNGTGETVNVTTCMIAEGSDV